MTQPLEVLHDWVAEQWDWPLNHQDGVVKVVNTAEKFEVGLEVSYFTPKEIKVNIINDELVVDCLHDERSDQHGRVTREIHRTYKLPLDVDKGTLKTNLSQGGVLTISANKKK